MNSSKVVAGSAIVAALGGIFFLAKALPAADDEKSAKQAAKDSAAKKPATHKVEKKPFKIELSLKGILEADETAEILYRPQPTINPPPSQGPLTIRKVVDHGARVRKDDLLATFDTRKIDAVIKDYEIEKKGLETGIKVAEEDLPPFEKMVPVELAAAEEASKHAREDLKYFVDVGRPQAESEVNLMLKSYSFMFEFAKEELAQLEKMYKANDLTEDTEKMVLKRQKHEVEMYSFFFRSAEIRRNYTLNVTLPRRDRALNENVVKQAILLDKARNTLLPTLTQRQQSLARMRHDLDKLNERLAYVHKERAALTIRSPMAGVVFHGKFHKGEWSLSSYLESKLAPGGTISPDEVFLTVVQQRPTHVRLTVDEKDAYLVKPGLQGKAKVLFNPDLAIAAKVARISSLPSAPGKFEAVAAVAIDDEASLMPGMACSVKFVPYFKKDAVAVPAASVFEEDDMHFVFVPRENGTPEKREVTPGRTAKEQTEIVAGLHDGEEILLERPDGKKTEKGATP